jgi:hypothetical protein
MDKDRWIRFRRRSGSFDSPENMNMLLHVVLKYTVKLEVAECQQMHIHNRSHPEGLC